MTFPCLPSCGACCGCVPLSKDLLEQHAYLMQGTLLENVTLPDGLVLPQTEDLLCVFLDRQKKTCLIYEQRPSVCRLYGITESLPCPYLKPNGQRRNPAQQRAIQRKINHDVDASLQKMTRRIPHACR